MGLLADYKGAKDIKNAYIKLERIWGSTKEGWNAFVGVYHKGSTTPDETFHVTTPFVDGVNPFDSLYAEVGKLSFLHNVKHEVSTTLNAVTADHLREKEKEREEAAKKELEATTVKKSRAKKV